MRELRADLYMCVKKKKMCVCMALVRQASALSARTHVAAAAAACCDIYNTLEAGDIYYTLYICVSSERTHIAQTTCRSSYIICASAQSSNYAICACAQSSHLHVIYIFFF